MANPPLVHVDPATGLVISDGRYPVADDAPVALPVRSSVVRCATFGDSITAVGTSQSPDTADWTELTAPFVTSTTSLGTLLEKWALPLYYPMAYMVFNGGISGEGAVEMAARDDAVASATRRAIYDVHDSRPDIIFTSSGSINNTANLSPTTLPSVITQIDVNHKLIIARLSTYGCPVVDEGIRGFSKPAIPAANVAEVRRVNMILNAIWKADAEASGGRVIWNDPIGVSCDTTGAYLPNMTPAADGIHLTTDGGMVRDQMRAAILTRLFGPSSRVRYPGTNLITNSLLNDVQGAAYGQFGRDWGLTVSNATRSEAAIVTRNGQRWQTCLFTVDTNPGFGAILPPFEPQTWGFADNAILGCEFDFFIENPSGAVLTPLSAGLQGRLSLVKNGVGIVQVEVLGATDTATLPSRIEGHCVIPPFHVQEQASDLTTASALTLLYYSSGVAGSAFRMGMSRPRAVVVS